MKQRIIEKIIRRFNKQHQGASYNYAEVGKPHQTTPLAISTNEGSTSVIHHNHQSELISETYDLIIKEVLELLESEKIKLTKTPLTTLEPIIRIESTINLIKNQMR